MLLVDIRHVVISDVMKSLVLIHMIDVLEQWLGSGPMGTTLSSRRSYLNH